MLRPLLTALALTLSTLPLTATAQDAIHLRGEVTGVDAQAVTVAATNGETVTVTMVPDYMLVVYSAIDVTDLAPGDFLSIPSMTGADGSKVAVSINVFPEAMRGLGEGVTDWDLGAGSLMTNATIGSVVATPDGNTLAVTYNGIAEDVLVPQGTPITRITPTPDQRLAPGDNAIIFVQIVDETATGGFAGIMADGTLPPV